MATSSDQVYSSSSIDDFLTCSICLEIFQDSKILDCQHTFCEPCLRQLPPLEGQLICPTCRRSTPLPVNGSKALISDFRMNQLIDRERNKKGTSLEARSAAAEEVEKGVKCSLCDEPPTSACLRCELTFCSHCETEHQYKENIEDHELITFSKDLICAEHPVSIAVKYCYNCSRGVCRACALRCGQQHEYVRITNYTKYCMTLEQEDRGLKSEMVELEKKKEDIRKLKDATDELQQQFGGLALSAIESVTQRIQAVNALYADKVIQLIERVSSGERIRNRLTNRLLKLENIETQVNKALGESPIYMMKYFDDLYNEIAELKSSRQDLPPPYGETKGRKILSDFESLILAYKNGIRDMDTSISKLTVRASADSLQALCEMGENQASSSQETGAWGHSKDESEASRSGGPTKSKKKSTVVHPYMRKY